MATLEVHVPIRNAPDRLEETIDSLRQQTTRAFSVVLSASHPAAGAGRTEQAVARLTAEGIEARQVTPPPALGRIEHWNWLHAGAEAPWVKPLLAGNRLEPGCLAALLETLAEHPEAGLVQTGYHLHREGRPTREILPAAPAGFRPASVMKREVLRSGEPCGPPGAYAFSSEAFRALGGYRPALPLTAPDLLCRTLAARFGVATRREPLCHLSPDEASPRPGAAARRRALLRETLTSHGLLLYHAWTEQEPIPWAGAARLFVRALGHSLYEH